MPSASAGQPQECPSPPPPPPPLSEHRVPRPQGCATCSWILSLLLFIRVLGRTVAASACSERVLRLLCPHPYVRPLLSLTP